MAEIMVMEKGRAKEWGLLGQAREAAALQVAAHIGWRRRYVETDRNPSDKDSRAPGTTEVDTVATEDAAEAAGQKDLESSRPPLRTGVDGDQAPAAVGKPSVQPQVATVRLPCCSAPPGLERLPPPSRKAAALGSSPPPAPRSRRAWARPGVLEVFAGHGGVTSACVEAGLRVLPPLELRRGRHCDVTLPAVARLLVAWILSGAVWALVLAPRCTLPCAVVLLRLLRAAKRAGVYVVVAAFAEGLGLGSSRTRRA
jgi:hypothetical protein